MSSALRVGAAIIPSDPYWVQVREAALAKAQELPLDLISLSIVDYPEALSQEEQMGLLEELLALELDALIAWALPDDLAHSIPQFGTPLVLLSETVVRHPLLVAPSGPHQVVRTGARYLAEKTKEGGSLLVTGDLVLPGRHGNTQSPIEGIHAAFGARSSLSISHVRCPRCEDYDQAHREISAAVAGNPRPVDAIFGLSDCLALASRDICLSLGLITPDAPVVGIGGTPEAMAAITEGRMTATVEIRPEQLGRHAVELAFQLSQGQTSPSYFEYETQLVTQQNVARVAARKLNAVANLYDRMMNTRRQQQQQRLTQLETSLEISRRVGSILDHRQLSHEIANLIRANYGYDRVQILQWLEPEQSLLLKQPEQDEGVVIPLAGSGVLGQALMRNEAIFVPDTHRSPRFSPDPNWPDTRARVVLPIRLGGQVVGLLDLHSRESTLRARQELVGLADQLGIAMSNADLYSEALQARIAAEKADQLKTRLLANVSHELRTPLNTILGFVKPVLEPHPSCRDQLPPGLTSDLEHVYRSAEHLLRVINDLLDLSRAEIDELDLHLEFLEPRPFLAQVFHSLADSAPPHGGVEWRLELPDRLPLIQADPVRLRQILLNLLSNARKFTTAGHILMGADVAPPHLHVWVEDTGIGIPPDWQERIFQPFVTAERMGTERSDQRPEGIGLGLSITRRLVALHRGSMTLESQHGQGSTFHIYLPLPSLSQEPVSSFAPSAQPVLLLICAQSQPAEEVAAFGQRRGLEIRHLRAGEDPGAVLDEVVPAALAWDLASATPADWTTIQRLRHHPRLGQAPFILYGQEQGCEPDLTFGMTNLITKPVSGQTLLDAINGLCPSVSAGPILIVDDDPQARERYQSIVADGLPGYPTRTAVDGTVAVSEMSQEPPCLVVLDLMMPEMDGFEVLNWMRGREETRRVPVLILSGRMLTLDDIQRLEQHALVTFQSKDILTEHETSAALHRLLLGADTLPPQTSALVKRTILYLQQNYASPLSRREIADAVGVSENYLSRIFRREVGITPWDYLNRFRIKKARELLTHSDQSITSVALTVGFSDPAYFSRVFRKQVGLSPSAYRERPETDQ
jgi:signal transduction histidine kinase/AraC-like DNA-binding protein